MQLLEPTVPGLRLPVSTPLEEVEAAVVGVETLVLEFAAFRDGRGFSLASILRERGWTGRLVAAGHVLPDQARHLKRSGFDAVERPVGDDPEPWARMLAAFDVVYQPAADAAVPAWRRRATVARADPDALAARLNAQVGEGGPVEILRAAFAVPGLKVAALSSFGAEAAVLLDLIAGTRPQTPVLFLETGMHFLQTLQYRAQLSARLGLTDVRLVVPDAEERAAIDPTDTLWRADPDACCDLRKVLPLARAAAGFDALITGRKRYQAGTRRELEAFEVLDGQLRINPLVPWSSEDVARHAAARDLPRHPLVDQGYASIGCWPCTSAVAEGEDARSGRWSGVDKVECGIHLGRRLQSAA
ncbi:phosphoadenosine phosphosulfate reductase [Brevundimonas sp. LM2]|uniref:phosphoadenylyl-sulfate reductase n=1 Tax=Brevundimonas sp. LM2 TaxID=1938605 RepID=UPI000983D4AA|nr:phosphoadenylyl-sulfate reductase [Brevundimonas sp. LM2]AQR61460.1 phosphoadenosine phosphosulfate reductase [Brevundimonas sp. LM2]